MNSMLDKSLSKQEKTKEATNANVRCTVEEWQNEMIQEGHYTDEIFVRTLGKLFYIQYYQTQIGREIE